MAAAFRGVLIEPNTPGRLDNTGVETQAVNHLTLFPTRAWNTDIDNAYAYRKNSGVFEYQSVKNK